MPKPGYMWVCVLVALAGCSTAPRAGKPRAPDWTSAEAARTMEVERVPNEPELAPPPVFAPTTPPPRTNTSTFVETWIPLERWSQENHAGTLRQISLTPLPTFALTTTNGVFVVQTRSRVARWDGLELHLGFEPQLIEGHPFVHALDLKKNIQPLIRGLSLPEKTNRAIVIDAGHGGLNTGTTNIVTGLNEKIFTLDWAARIAELLATNGWQVFLTRTNDVDVSLADRIAFADEHKADVFISLHFNSAWPYQEQSGLETYCLTPAGMPSTLTREFEDNPSLVFTNNSFDAENLQYALRLHRALLQTSGMTDRGVRRARFLGVLRGQNRPAILIEGGYLSNPREARRVADPAYRQKLAEAVAVALMEKPETTRPATEIENQGVNAPASNSSPHNPPFH